MMIPVMILLPTGVSHGPWPMAAQMAAGALALWTQQGLEAQVVVAC